MTDLPDLVLTEDTTFDEITCWSDCVVLDGVRYRKVTTQGYSVTARRLRYVADPTPELPYGWPWPE